MRISIGNVVLYHQTTGHNILFCYATYGLQIRASGGPQPTPKPPKVGFRQDSIICSDV